MACCKFSKSCYVYPLATIVVTLSCAVLGLTSHELAGMTSFTQYTEAGFVNGTGTCLLSGTGRNHNVCKYAYAAGGVSLIIGMVMIIVQIAITSMCGTGDSEEDGCCASCCGSCIKFINTIVAILMGIWWLVAAAFFSKEYFTAERGGLPKHAQREAVVGLSWGLCVTWLLFMLADMCGNCCLCCRSDPEDGKPAKKKAQATNEKYRKMAA